MSQLHTVLRRSVAHLDPSDHDGRERTFTNAREAMIRLLWSYDPPLTPKEIDSKIDEFDAVVATIADEGRSPEAEADDESDAEPAEPAATRNPAAPHNLAVPKSEIVAAPAAIPFSAALALPPREPVRKLARFEPLSQIGSPTPLGDGAKARSAAPAEAGPASPDAAVIAALAALDMAAGTDKKPAAKTEPAKTEPAKTEPKAAETLAREADDEVGLLDEEVDPFDLDGRDVDGDAEDDEPYADDEDRADADDEASDEADDAEADESDGDDATSAWDDDDDRPETAEEVLRLHQERFHRRITPADEAEDERDEEPDADEQDPDEPDRDADDEDEPDDDLRDEDPQDEDLRDDDDPLGEDEPRPTLGERLRNLTDAVSGRMIAIVAGVMLVLVAGLGGAAFFLSRSPTPATTAEGAPAAPAAPARPTDIAGVIAASDPPPQNPAPARAEPQPAPPAAAGGDMLALETLNLFDGRDPSVFQSMPDNPVRFQGDTQGGFARVSSSINSTGSRITVGRGVYERLGGRTIRIVVVARAASATPAHSLRFAYQNGRSLSPWKDGALGADYAPLSATWTVPKDRGGPETDAVLIEPGIPGDGTAADIKSVRIEVLK